MTKIYLVRHGETEWNRLGLYQGTTDIPLNQRGREQALQLAGTLRRVRFDAAYTSPLRRAQDTAAAVLGNDSVPLVPYPELREISYGLWQGRSSRAHVHCSPGLAWRWRDNPWGVRFPGGETLEEVRNRAGAALDGIIAAHSGATILISGHGHLNRVLLIHALEWPRERFWEIDQPNGCCYVLQVSASGNSVSTLHA